MEKEIEAKFANVNHGEVRKKLRDVGAKLEKPMRTMRRVTIDNEFMKTDKDSFVRIRDEGDKVTITYKQFDKLSLDGVYEVEIEVNDFEKAVELFKEAGLVHGSFQESKRESWTLGEVKIELDEWPWLDPYIEIEGPDEKSVKEVADKLGLGWENAVFGDVMTVYRVQYPHLTEKDTVGNIPEERNRMNLRVEKVAGDKNLLLFKIDGRVTLAVAVTVFGTVFKMEGYSRDRQLCRFIKHNIR